jgi:hypothetical protein
MSARLIGLALAFLMALGAGAAAAEEDATPPSGTAPPSMDEGTDDALEPSEELMGEPTLAAEEDVPEEPASDGSVPDFEVMPDRWRIQPPPYPEVNVIGHWWDPYNTNPLKGDLPIPGFQDIFGKITAAYLLNVEGRKFPIASGVSTENPGESNFFGDPESILIDQKFVVQAEILKGATSYKPFDWQFLLQGVGDLASLTLFERVVFPDVREGTDFFLGDIELETGFLEVHLADLSANYDFLSTKIGRQPFNSDFRSLIFRDINQAARLFGSAASGRIQYNLWYEYAAEKDIVSELNTFEIRNQQIVIANAYIQDFFFNGWTNSFSFHLDYDEGSKDGFVYDRLGFLARPTAIGDPRPHDVTAYYLGWASEGHIGPINVSHAFYEVLGTDEFNGIAGREVDINGQLAFLELSYDIDWIRPILSVYFASGDDDPRDGTASGFDSILDAPRVAGGAFSWFNRQSIRITDRGGAGLNQRLSLIPDLRSSKLQGQVNMVNPGIVLLNAGTEIEATPKVRVIANASYIRFAETGSLKLALQQSEVDANVGVDLSIGVEWRPWLNNNVIVTPFAALFQPLDGFQDIYTGATQWQAGFNLALVY